MFGVQDVDDAYAVAAGEQHHAPREPEGPWPTSSPARALCWLAAAEQQVVFDEPVEITDCQLGQLITGKSGFGGGICHRRMPPRSGRETSARIDRAPKSPYPVGCSV